VSGTLFNGSRVNGEPRVADFDDRHFEIRRTSVIRIASRLAGKQDGAEIRVPEVVEAVNREGVNLGVQKNREITVVSNILRRSPEFRKTARNVFEYVG
jgi:hypothetical protein